MNFHFTIEICSTCLYEVKCVFSSNSTENVGTLHFDESQFTTRYTISSIDSISPRHPRQSMYCQQYAKIIVTSLLSHATRHLNTTYQATIRSTVDTMWGNKAIEWWVSYIISYFIFDEIHPDVFSTESFRFVSSNGGEVARKLIKAMTCDYDRKHVTRRQ